ncbi:MAG TPA: TRAP transporter substrate-binding protein DctP [Candidatus Lachnoclostridium stercoripullorum]|uniref:TRAP transporter substrate-binding protein DctP n=1 Tax=Candidatus Lachnoclostridium stercoripullorum TaxID=2838635 RepID=A0A9D1W5C7_9FIRM|nr:TRAP transporter substrate-binding protein DctP [Candidatus Lachnoclostridium stercoripullorum]
MRRKWHGEHHCGAGTAGRCGNAGEDSGNVPVGDPITLTFAHGQAEGHPYQQAALYFKELAEEESGGSITVVVSPNGTLGDERECVESLQMGTLDITAAVASALSGFDPDMDVFNMPYLFESRSRRLKCWTERWDRNYLPIWRARESKCLEPTTSAFGA